MNKVIFYFPWKELSGGPIYLANLANYLAEYTDYEVYYTLYQGSFIEDSLSVNVSKIYVNEDDFSIPFEDPVILVMPIYFAAWVPEVNLSSKIIFFNWHVCSLTNLLDNWALAEDELLSFLTSLDVNDAVFFLDESHRLGHSVKGLDPKPVFVPINVKMSNDLSCAPKGLNDPIKICVIGRLVKDKIYSILSVIDNIDALGENNNLEINIIGDGPFWGLLQNKICRNVKLNYMGSINYDCLHSVLVNMDVVFGMGTSVLDAVVCQVPAVIIPNETIPFNDDRYVKFHDTTNFCLGWTLEQIDQLDLNVRSMKEIIECISDDVSRAQWVKDDADYYNKNFDKKVVVNNFVNVVKGVKFTKEMLNEFYYKFPRNSKIFKIFGIIKFRLFVTGLDFKYINILKYNKAITFTRRSKKSDWTARVLGFPICVVKKFNKFHAVLPYIPDWKARRENVRQLENADLVKQIVDTTLFKIGNVSESISNRIQLELDIIGSRHLQIVNNLELDLKNHFKNEIIRLKDDVLTSNSRNLELLKDGIFNIDSSAYIRVNAYDETIGDDYFCEFVEDNFQNFQNLISGLDEESIDVVVRSLNRVNEFYRTKNKYYRLTSDELRSCLEVIDNYKSKLVQFSDDKMWYDGRIFYNTPITSSVLVHHHFIDEFLDDIDNKMSGNILDIGGATGDSAIILANYTSDKVFSFEPNPINYSVAIKNVEVNKIENIEILQFIVSSESDKDGLIYKSDDYSTTIKNSAFFNAENCETSIVSTISVDDFVVRNNITVSLIKIDVEGAEMDVLYGAVETIRQQKPVLLISIYHSASDFYGIKPFLEKLCPGYAFKIRKPADSSILNDMTLIATFSEGK